MIINDYRYDPKFLDIQVWANNADPDQTAPRGTVWSGSTLFAIPFASFGRITPCKIHNLAKFSIITVFFLVSKFLEVLW